MALRAQETQGAPKPAIRGTSTAGLGGHPAGTLWACLCEGSGDPRLTPQPSIWPTGNAAVHRGSAQQLCGRLGCRYLHLGAGLEWTWFGESLDQFDLCAVLGDALGGQMRI